MNKLATYISETSGQNKNILILGYFNMQGNKTNHQDAQQFKKHDGGLRSGSISEFWYSYQWKHS